MICKTSEAFYPVFMKTFITIVTLSLSFSFVSCASKKASTPQPATGKTAKETAASKPTAEKAKPVASATEDGVTVVSAVACRSVNGRSPVGEAESFPPDVGRVYLFTQVNSESPKTSIQHIWSYNGKKMAEVTLPINGSNWRTYSSKSIDPSMKGDWKVDVTTTKGTVLKSANFKIQ
jgi:hypothetical protein